MLAFAMYVHKLESEFSDLIDKECNFIRNRGDQPSPQQYERMDKIETELDQLDIWLSRFHID